MIRFRQGPGGLFTFLIVIFRTMLVIIFLGQSTSLAQTTVFERAKQSIVYIYFDVTDNATGAKSPIVGTGFIVSKNGYVITASHLFRDWRDQSSSEKTKNEIKGTLHDKPGYVPESPLVLEIVNVGNPDAEDVALLKLPDPIGQGYPVAPICFKEGSSAKIGDDLIAFGFPMGGTLQPVKATLGTQNAAGGRWAAASAFARGMSGGPVYNALGYVMGMVKGGLKETDAVRWITPIGFAKSFLLPPFEEECDSPVVQLTGSSRADELADFNDTVQPLYFVGRTGLLDKGERQHLTEIAIALLRINPKKITLRSQTSKVSPGLNVGISKSRGELVKEALIYSFGVQGEITVVPYGGSKANINTDDPYDQRVEINISD